MAFSVHGNASTPGVVIAGGNGAGSALNQLNQPVNIFTDAANNLFIADAGNNRILKLAYGATTPTVVAGGWGQGNGINQLNYPTGVCTDMFGNIFVADYNNHRVQMWPTDTAYTIDTTYVPTQPGIYYAVVTAKGGCGSVISDSITISPTAPATVSISVTTDTVCNASAVVVTPHPVHGGAPVYQWMVDDTLAATNSGTFSTSHLHSGDTVSVVMTSNSGCATLLTAQSNGIGFYVIPNAVPSVSITAGATDTICVGSSLTLTASPANGGTSPTYAWYVNDTWAGTGASFLHSGYRNNDKVRVVLTSNAVCALPATASDTIAIVVSPLTAPQVSITANPVGSVCAGTPITFTATAVNGGAAPAYQWKLNGSNAGGNSSTYTGSSFNNNDVVSCVLTSNAQCLSVTTATSNLDTVSVQGTVHPAVSVSAAQAYFCGGTQASFIATATGGGSSPVYQWTVNGVVSGGNTDTFSSSTLHNGDVLVCKVTSSLACASPDTALSSGVAAVITAPVTPTVTVGANPLSLACNGSNIVYTATTTGGGTSPVYQWVRNGVNVGTNSNTYTDVAVVNRDTVKCVLTSNAACAVNPATSNTVSVPVSPVLSGHITRSICAGTSYNFNGTHISSAGTYVDTLVSFGGCDSVVTLTLSVIQPVTSAISRSICPGGSFNFNGTIETTAGTYNDTLVSAVSGCDSIVTLTLTVNPVLTTMFSQSVCSGQSYNFNGQMLSTAGFYHDTLTFSVTGCDSIVTLILSVGNAVTSSINVSTCAGDTYNFNGRTITAAGAYNDTLPSSVSGCDSIVTLNLSWIQPVRTSLRDTICTGDSVNFSGTVLHAAGTYADTLLASGGCDSIVTLTLVVNPLPVVTVPADTSVCVGSSVSLTAVSPGSTLLWQGGYSNGQNVVINQNMQFVVSAGALGCAVTDTFRVRANTAAGTLHNTNTTACVGDTITLSASGGSSYYWRGNVSGNISTDSVAPLVVNASQEILVTILSNGGCVLNDSFAVVMLPEKVWPGDANEDLVVDNFDILAIGIAYGATGPVRPNASLTWQEQCAPAWTGSFSNGTNYAFADCNGDGVINYTDTDAVSLNYSLTHTRAGAQRSGTLPLMVHTNASVYHAGDTVTGQILLGTAAIPATTVYGLAFTFEAGPFAKPNTVQVTLANSWMLAAGNELTFTRRKTGTSVDVAQTRINHANTTGYGAIANFSFVVDSGVANGSLITIAATTSLCVNAHGDTIGLNATTDSVTAIVNGINTLDGNEVAVYPNPTTGAVVIQLTGLVTATPTAEVYNQLGQIVLTEMLTKNANVINLSAFASGVYTIRISSPGGLTATRKVCLTK